MRSSLPLLIKKKKRDSRVFEKVAAFVGVFDSRSVNGGCCVLFRLCMNRRFVCQMTFRQWLQDGWEEGGREEREREKRREGGCQRRRRRQSYERRLMLLWSAEEQRGQQVKTE